MEMLVRLSAFVSVFSCMAVWEYWTPCRQLLRPRRERWVTNLSLTTLNSLLVWATVGSVAYATAVFAAEQGVGVLHWIVLPPWAASPWAASPWTAAVVTLLGLDFAVYLHHVLFHAVPIFWRLHQVHHADLDIDTTTGLRFHPCEIFLSFGLKMAVIILLGAVPWVVVAFEILLNASSVFNHGNVAIPERVDAWLRWFLVTPDMHRIHHSTRTVESNSNFGFSFSCWDRICGTYRAHPALGHRRMDIGLSDYRTPLTLSQLLLLPFQGSADRSSLIRRWRPVRTMSPQQLQALIAQGNSPLVLDVRNPDEFSGERGHITGVVLSPIIRRGIRGCQLSRAFSLTAVGRARYKSARRT
jgi:sterol desaturase/sphingolipid hydroxylase (fatty acid hydroxylase superfamily)